jgi:hypothetical protein
MDVNIPRKLASTVMPLIQEIKINIVFRRYKRETTAYNHITVGTELQGIY